MYIQADIGHFIGFFIFFIFVINAITKLSKSSKRTQPQREIENDSPNSVFQSPLLEKPTRSSLNEYDELKELFASPEENTYQEEERYEQPTRERNLVESSIPDEESLAPIKNPKPERWTSTKPITERRQEKRKKKIRKRSLSLDLRDAESIRRAIILREILGPCIANRD